MVKNMTSGRPIKLILLFSLPVFFGQLFQQLYMIGDLVIVGRYLGVESLAALGGTIPIFVVLLMMSFGFTSGLSVIVAQRFGARDTDGIRHSYATGLVLSGIFAVLSMGICIPLLPDILKQMNVPAALTTLSHDFIGTLIWGISGMVFYNYLSNVLRALGDSKTPLYFLIFSCVFNLLLNLWLIVSLGFGVKGSALGSVCAQMTSVILCAVYFVIRYPVLRLKRSDFNMTAAFIWAHVRLGLPTALQFSVIGLGALVIQAVCNRFGMNAIAAMVASLRVEQLFTLPLMSLGPSMVVYAAQNFGACRIRRIREGVRQGSLFSFLLSFLIAAVVYIWGEKIILLFLKEPNAEIVSLSHQYLKTTTLFYCFLGQIFVFRQTLQGIGQPMVPLISGFIEFGMRSFSALILAAAFGFPGLCYASPAAWIGAAAVVALGYRYYIRRLACGCFSGRKKKVA